MAASSSPWAVTTAVDGCSHPVAKCAVWQSVGSMRDSGLAEWGCEAVDIVTPSVGIRDSYCGSRQKNRPCVLKAFAAGPKFCPARHLTLPAGCELNLF